MRFDVLTIFPEFFSSPIRQSIMGKALEKGLIAVKTHNIRDYAADRHKTTDDYPYGGGRGMVMKAEPVAKALDDIAPLPRQGAKVLLTTPQGRKFDQALAVELTALERLVIVCGRYEGFDERIRSLVDMEVSIGDFVLTGGEIPALAIMDCVSRLLPGVVGERESIERDSFSDGLLEHPQYTRPEEFRGMKVPEVLLSGNHASIAAWRRAESLKRTAQRRPDLLKKAALSDNDLKLLKALGYNP